MSFLTDLINKKNVVDKFPFPPSGCDDATVKYIGLRTAIAEKYGSMANAAKSISSEEVQLSQAYESYLKNCGLSEATILAIRNNPESVGSAGSGSAGGSGTIPSVVTDDPYAADPSSPAIDSGSGNVATSNLSVQQAAEKSEEEKNKMNWILIGSVTVAVIIIAFGIYKYRKGKAAK